MTDVAAKHHMSPRTSLATRADQARAFMVARGPDRVMHPLTSDAHDERQYSELWRDIATRRGKHRVPIPTGLSAPCAADCSVEVHDHGGQPWRFTGTR
jgi:hypothetical protein